MTEILTGVVLRWVLLASVAVFFAYLILKVFRLFLASMDPSEKNPKSGVWIESNWGGLGGGLSGWHVSNSISYFLLMSLLLGCLSLVVCSLGSAPEKKEAIQKEAGESEQKSAAGKAANQKKDEIGKTGTGEDKKSELARDDQNSNNSKTPGSSTGDKDLKKPNAVPAADKKVE
jgi:hypothetical protein